MNSKTKKIVMMGVLTAIVIVLQFVSMAIRTATFSITLSLVPIVVGAALFGKLAGAWLGFVFGIAVLLTGDAAPFMTVSVFGTITTVLVKGTLCGLLAGLVYELLKKKNETVATYVAGIITPIINTGIFLLGCLIFFLPTIREWGAEKGFESVGKYMLIVLVGFNFLIELSINLIFSPTIARIIKIGKKDY